VPSPGTRAVAGSKTLLDLGHGSRELRPELRLLLSDFKEVEELLAGAGFGGFAGAELGFDGWGWSLLFQGRRGCRLLQADGLAALSPVQRSGSMSNTNRLFTLQGLEQWADISRLSCLSLSG
jgi:hypothetical protein